jgi:glutamine amidotransferase
MRLSENAHFNGKISHLLLPGVGGFDETMDLLDAKNWSDWLNHMVLIEKMPILGVCVGMQIMLDISSEGERCGFGWIKGNVEKIPNNDVLPLPHMGWNSVEPLYDPFFAGIDLEKGFYFLHNYRVCPSNEEVVWATSSYISKIPVVISCGNVIGVQFHPEKSLVNGAQIFKNFFNIFNHVKV